MAPVAMCVWMRPSKILLQNKGLFVSRLCLCCSQRLAQAKQSAVLGTGTLFPGRSGRMERSSLPPGDSLRLASAATIKPTPKQAATALGQPKEAALEDLENRRLPPYCLKAAVGLLHLPVGHPTAPSIAMLQLRLSQEPRDHLQIQL